MGKTEQSLRRQHQTEIVVGSFFISAIIATNVIAAKLTTFFGTTFTVGALVYPLTFLLTDIISEVFGKKQARRWVWLGLSSSMIVMLFIWLGGLVAESEFSNVRECYGRVFAGTPRVIFGSMMAYLVSQQVDVWLFHKIRKRTEGRHLWLRNNVATSLSQGIDTTIFCLIAFAGVVPGSVLGGMIVGQYVIKVIMAAADTPLCYLGVHVVKRIIK